MSDDSQLLIDALLSSPEKATDPLPDPSKDGSDKVVVTLAGKVSRLFFSSPEFSAGRLRTDDGKDVSFSGPLMVKEHDQVALRGSFERHERYGMQLKCESFEFRQDLSSSGLVDLLSNHPSFRGVGFRTAQKLVEKFGSAFGDTLENSPEIIAEAAGKKPEEVERWRAAWLGTKETNQTMAWLSSLGMTYKQVCKLIDALGNSARTVLEKDPYLIIPRVPGFGWKRADELARAMGVEGSHPGRVRGCILHVLDQALESGSTAVGRSQLIGYCRRLLSERAEVEGKTVAAALDELLASEVVSSVPLPLGPFDEIADDLVGHAKMYEKEVWLRDFFRDAGERENTRSGRLPKLQSRQGLKARQAEALDAAREKQAVLIAGSAGSGKTFTVQAVCDAYDAMGLSIRLAAPTGKAARRMEEVCGRPAETIHRLLEWKGKFQRGPAGDSELGPIEADVVIVDEVSMLDVPLACSLFRAIDMDRTNLVLVGDPNQLPPVGAGNVLRDLIRRKFIPTVELDEVVRQAGVLKENSSAILKGDVRKNVPATESGDKQESPWIVAAGKAFYQPKDARDYILKLYREVLQERLGFDVTRDVQLLTPRHDGPLGTEELNRELQAIVQWKMYKREVPLPKGNQKKPRPILYDRVIQTRNNYELDVMNGSVGVVTKEAPLTVDYDGGPATGGIEYDKSSAHEVELAYALTVHKSQGSEFPCVVSVLHAAHGFMLHRGLFYTAVTRARRTAIIVGDPKGVSVAAQKVEVDRRRTFLSVI